MASTLVESIMLKNCRCLYMVAFWMAMVAIFVGPCCAVDVADVITKDKFNSFLSMRNNAGCESPGFYTYDAFIEAASFYKWNGDFGSKKHELAAFFAHVAHETTYGCYVREINRDPANGNYYGRGPLQLTHDYNYQPAGEYIQEDLIGNPDLVATNAVVSFQTAIWFWMTQPTSDKNPHACMDNRSPSDFGCTIRAINSQECGLPVSGDAQDRVDKYKTFCNTLGISVPTQNLNCS